MHKKDYYALNDVPKRFDVNLPTIKKLIDQKKITPVFDLHPMRLVIGGIDKDRHFVGYGTGVYKGMISIQRSQFSELWQNNRVESNFLILLNAQNISEYSETNPFTVDFPNGFIRSWQSTPLADITRNRIIAICMPQYLSFRRSSKFIFDEPEAIEALDDQDSFEIETAESEYRWLEQTKLKLELSEARISHSDLISSGAIKQNFAHDTLPAKATANAPPAGKYANPFHSLIAKVLLKYPDITVKKLFRIFAAEAHSDIDEREFDTDNVLADEIDGVIFWNDVTRKTGLAKCSYNTLKNPVREVKIAIRSKSG